MTVFHITGGKRGSHTLLLDPGEKPVLEEGERITNLLTFDRLRQANISRLQHFPGHGENDEPWTPNDWMTALVGEVGELANHLKKIRRSTAYPGMKWPSKEDISEELADIATYLDLLAFVLGVDLDEAIVRKFNEVSERWGLDDRL